jgi:hypothetical protein
MIISPVALCGCETCSFTLRKITYDGVSKSFRTGRLQRELQMVQLSATRWNCIAILWVSLLSFAAITLCVASQRVFIVVVYFVISSVRNLLDITSYIEVVLMRTFRSDSTSVVTRLRAGRPRFDSWQWLAIFPFSTAFRPVLGLNQTPIQWLPVAISSGVKRPGREADHSHLSSAEAKNAWSYTSSPLIGLHGVVLN